MKHVHHFAMQRGCSPGFFFISIMKVYDNFPKAKHQALKNTIEMIAEEEIITLIGFQDQVQVQVAVHIVSNQGSVD